MLLGAKANLPSLITSALFEMLQNKSPSVGAFRGTTSGQCPCRRRAWGRARRVTHRQELEESWRGTNSRDCRSLWGKTREEAAERELFFSKAVFTACQNYDFLKKSVKTNEQISSSCATSREAFLMIVSSSLGPIQPFKLNCTASWSDKIFQPFIFWGREPSGLHQDQ